MVVETPISSATRRSERARALALIVVVSTVACEDAPTLSESTCVPTSGLSGVPAVDERVTAAVYWDVSKSMTRFAAKDGPLSVLNDRVESQVLQGSEVMEFEHFSVAATLDPMSPLPQPIRLTGDWSNLPEVAYRSGQIFVDKSAPTMVLVVSDMMVEIPPALQKREEGVETPCGLPITAMPSTEDAPFLLRDCMKAALGEVAITHEGWMSVVRWSIGDKAMYALVTSRSFTLGEAVHGALKSLPTGASVSDKVIFGFSTDVTQSAGSPGVCRFDPSVDDPIVMEHGSETRTPTCRFRFRGATAPPHTLRCSIPTLNDGISEGLLFPVISGVRRGDHELPIDGTASWYEVTTSWAGGGDVGMHRVLTSSLVANSDAQLSAFAAEPDSSAGAALGGVAAALEGRLIPASGAGWTVRYEGR